MKKVWSGVEAASENFAPLNYFTAEKKVTKMWRSEREIERKIVDNKLFSDEREKRENWIKLLPTLSPL